LLEAVEARADESTASALPSASKLERRRARLRPAARHGGANKGVSAPEPGPCIRDAQRKLSPDDVVLNEAIPHGPVLQEHAHPHPAEELCRLAGGGSGISGGLALGLKLAQPAAASYR